MRKIKQDGEDLVTPRGYRVTGIHVDKRHRRAGSRGITSPD